MNSFTVFAIGQLAQEPELRRKGETAYTQFALIGNDYAGKAKEEIATSVYFVAFGATGETIAAHARRGDQLIVQAQIRANNWTDTETGELHYAHSFVVQSFKFGSPGKAKRAQLAKRK